MAIQVRKNGNLVVTMRLTLVPGRDDDLIVLVRSAPRGLLAGVVRESLRSGVIPLRLEVSNEEDDEDTSQFMDLLGLGMDL